MIHERGALYAVSTDNTRHPFESPNPKVYLPVGNCLIGHIDTRDCMTTRGCIAEVRADDRHTAVTFYGYMGWGTGCCSRMDA